LRVHTFGHVCFPKLKLISASNKLCNSLDISVLACALEFDKMRVVNGTLARGALFSPILLRIKNTPLCFLNPLKLHLAIIKLSKSSL
jgi:hypothetical protein